jgi:uncharacterized protein (TIGR03437 family)
MMYCFKLLKLFPLVAGALFTSAAFGEAVKVNGTCMIGNCTTPDTLNVGQTLDQPFNFTYTLANGDMYQIQGILAHQNNGGTEWSNYGAQLLVTYLGNRSGTTALSGADVVTVDFLQNFQNAGVTSAYGSYTLIGDFVGPIASPGSSVARTVFFNNAPFPTLGPVSPPPNMFSESFQDAPNYVSGSLMLYDSRWTFSFGAGSGPGAGVVFGTFPQPTITPGGVVPLFSSLSTIEPGSWVSIYGTNLAGANAVWNGDFPTSLAGVTVTIDSRAAYLWYVSPTQINLQAPDDAATGPVSVVVTTPGGTASSTVTLAEFAPSFSLLDTKHVAGIILRANGSGAYGGGTYDILGPTGSSLGYATVAAKPGDVVELFGVGFGPTHPVVLAGQAFSGGAPTTDPVSLLINNVSVTPAFAGLSSAGLYQINLIVPAGLGTGDVSLVATVGGVQTPSGVVISLAAPNGVVTPQLQSLTLSASSVAGGGTAQGTVTLSAAAPSGGAVVSLSSNSTPVTVPASVTVPTGATSATFTVTAGTVSSGQTATITASYSGSSAQASLAVSASAGAVLPQFTQLTAVVSFSANQMTFEGTVSVGIVEPVASPLAVGNIGGVSLPPAAVPALTFAAAFGAVSEAGNTLILSGVTGGDNLMTANGSATYAITAGSVTFTLTPISTTPTSGVTSEVQVGTATGTFTLTSALETLTGTLSGTYTALLF